MFKLLLRVAALAYKASSIVENDNTSVGLYVLLLSLSLSLSLSSNESNRLEIAYIALTCCCFFLAQLSNAFSKMCAERSRDRSSKTARSLAHSLYWLVSHQAEPAGHTSTYVYTTTTTLHTYTRTDRPTDRRMNYCCCCYIELRGNSKQAAALSLASFYIARYIANRALQELKLTK